MVATSSKPQGAMTGKRYIESLRDGREVWIDGKRVDDVTTHPAFRDMIKALADVYDLQNSDQYRDEMTYVDPEIGSAHQPLLAPAQVAARTRPRKRRNSQLWNMLTWGQLGRSPDILAPFICNMVPRRDAVLRLQERPLRLRREHPQLLPLLPRQRPLPHPRPRRPAGRPQHAAPERAPRRARGRGDCAARRRGDGGRRHRQRRQAALDRRGAQQRDATSRCRRPSSPATTRASSSPSRSRPTRRA